ncbi:STAS domain-containing protein [Cognatishimia activa]|uniref:STAS domain-containing protein n=1 Tax=Cognatishimia activa TaxID=1715691 RepID=UPI0022306F10|nr:STAS domain-containing protein [Cognatishimia activa]UZD90942.1 STAS domain-containing protein [Cognatishimia activa]
MDVQSDFTKDILIVTVPDNRIDAAVALQFKEAMRQATNNNAERIVLDLRNVDFVDSSGLGAIVGAMKQLPSNKSLDLSGLTPTVAKVFQLTRMDTIFSIYPDVETAMNGGDP